MLTIPAVGGRWGGADGSRVAGAQAMTRATRRTAWTDRSRETIDATSRAQIKPARRPFAHH